MLKSNETLWVEKYRPSTIDECILPKHLKDTFEALIEKGDVFNMMFKGPRGGGKTTVARAICETLDLDYLLINGSKDSGINVLRTQIEQFASAVSLNGGDKPKVVILDEADYLNAQSTQPALRGFIEAFSSNCRFIFTCNHPNRIIPELHSRCTSFEFKSTKSDLAKLMGQFLKRLEFILNNEGIEYEEKVLAEVIMKFGPDWRRVIGECQRYSVSGKIDSGILVNLADLSIESLAKYLKNKDFKNMRKWVADNIDIDATQLFRKIFDQMNEYAKPQSIPQIVLILADYQYKQAFVACSELNVVACMTELMANAEWK